MNTIVKYIHFLKYERGYSSHTLSAYQQDLLEFETFCHAEIVTLEAIDEKFLSYYVLHLVKKGLSHKSIKRKLSALSSYFTYLIEQGLLNTNPCYYLDSIKISKRLPEFLYAQEIKYLLDACQTPREKLLVLLLFTTGIRVSELVSLKKDLPFDNKLCILGKGNKERIIILTREVVEVWQKYLKMRDDQCEFLFVNNRYSQLTQRGVRYILNKVALNSQVNKNIYPHLLRHSFATTYLNSGASLREVQTLLGHSSISSTQIYTHLSKDKIQKIHRAAHPRGKKSCSK